MQVLFKVVRQNQGMPPHVQPYLLEVEQGTTILDCLNRIKWEQDGSLAFRKNCRNTICGSCAVRMNGRSVLACKENVGSELARQQQSQAMRVPPAAASPAGPSASDPVPEITLAPLGNLPVIKDLVVDMQDFWQNLAVIDPYVSTASRHRGNSQSTALPLTESLQTPAERAKLDQPGNCILCGACYSECNAREVNPAFVGPHALAKAYRTLADSRDDRTLERLDRYNQENTGVWACTRCFNCNTACPMDVAPLDQISQIKGEILARQDDQANRAIRHRKTLLSLVKRSGWIDERRFGLEVVTNQWRDLQGFFSLLPLGVRMLLCGKFPTRFEPSSGRRAIRALIEAVESESIQSQSSHSDTH